MNIKANKISKTANNMYTAVYHSIFYALFSPVIIMQGLIKMV
jgi:hypothetical protein